MENISVALLTTSYPRNDRDDAGIFVKRLVEGFGDNNIIGTVIVPIDSHEPREETGNFFIKRFAYGLFSKGRLAFGAGMLPNIRRNYLLIAQLPLLLFGFIWTLLRLKKKVDVVHANWLFTGLAAYVYRIFTNTPYIITVRGEDLKLLHNRLLHFFLKTTLKNAFAIVTVSEEFSKTVKNLLPELIQKIHCIPNGVATQDIDLDKIENFKKTKVFSDQVTRFLFVGSVIPRKDLSTLLKALAAINRKQTVELVICGRLDDITYLNQLKSEINELGIERSVRFEGPVAPKEIGLYSSCARYYVSASQFEGRPNAVIEALAFGMVSILSDIPAHRELIRDGENGFLFPVRNADALAERILYLEGRKAEREKVGSAAKKSPFLTTWSDSAKQYRELFEVVLKTK